MAMPTFTMRQLLEAGVHFGHHTRRWNPKMKPYLFGVRNGVHIIDLTRPCRCWSRRCSRSARSWPTAAACCSSAPRRPPPSASPTRPSAAASTTSTTAGWAACSPTGRPSPPRSSACASSMTGCKGDVVGLTKKEQLDLTRERDKLERSLGGIKEMGGLPDMLFIIDTNKETIAVAGSPQAAAFRSWRCSTATPIPTASTIPIPGNDDAIRAMSLYCDLIVGRRARRHPRRDRRFRRRRRRARRAAGRGSSRRPRPTARAPRHRRPSRPALPRTESGAGRKTGPMLHRDGAERWLRSPHRWSRNCARRPAPA